MQTVLYELEMQCTKILQLPHQRCRNSYQTQYIMRTADWWNGSYSCPL